LRGKKKEKETAFFSLAGCAVLCCAGFSWLLGAIKTVLRVSP
jgi:hypothetical protein